MSNLGLEYIVYHEHQITRCLDQGKLKMEKLAQAGYPVS